MNKKMVMLVFITLILIMIRFICNAHKDLVYINAGINIVALLYVIYTIIERIEDKIKNTVQDKRPKQIISRDTKILKHKIKFWSLSICFLLTVIYFALFCCNLGNDIISIIALGCSILDDEIVNIIHL